MLDAYTIGKASRISPEAPVAVVRVIHEETKAGGAGNVALNLISLGLDVAILGRIGTDDAGEVLKKILREEKIDVTSLVAQPNYKTPIKNRIIADNQQIVRIDREQEAPLSKEIEEQVIASFSLLFEGVAAVAISDYGKGFLTNALLQQIMQEAISLNIPVITDPKGVDFSKYRGTTIIKPNLSESYAASGMPKDASLDRVAEAILAKTDAQTVLITRSEAGISIFQNEEQRIDCPVSIRQIRDVTGAGDTVLAVITCAIACGVEIQEAAELSNVAAGIAIERPGCARISIADMAERLLDGDVITKVFDEKNIFALMKMLESSSYVVLDLSAEVDITLNTFRAIQTLANLENLKVVIYLQKEMSGLNLIQFLSSLHEVKYIVQQNESLNRLYQKMPPNEVYTIQEGALAKMSSTMEVVTL